MHMQNEATLGKFCKREKKKNKTECKKIQLKKGQRPKDDIKKIFGRDKKLKVKIVENRTKIEKKNVSLLQS